ncbi:MAG: universal stress protein [Parafilimonas sp.]
MQTIIAPTDFSKKSLNAVNYAADMAMELHARLLILHAVEMPFKAGGVYEEPTDDEIEVEKKLSKLKDDLVKKTANKVPIHTSRVIGFIETEIVKICEYKKPLAVVMATQGARIKEHFFVGSITVHLSKNLKYPVIVIPPNVRYKPIKKILLATDLENLSSFPVENITAIVTAFNAKLDIVHVYKNNDRFETMEARMRTLYNSLIDLNPRFHFIKSKNVYKAITNFAQENKEDIILTFPHKHVLFYKSQSKQLIFNSPVAVMSIQ